MIRDRMIILLKKITHINDKLLGSFIELLERRTDDTTLYAFLKQHQKKQHKKSSGYVHAQDILNILEPLNQQIKYFLDFGAGTGVKANAVKNILNLDNRNVYALDIPSFESVDNQQNKFEFNYLYYDGINFPEFNVSFDLITCIQVLHHIREITHVIKWIKQKLKKDGILIIKEHAVDDNPYTGTLIDIEHSLYELVIDNNKDFIHKYYARYFTELEFLRMMTLNGFIYIQPTVPYKPDNTNPTNYIYYTFTH